MLRKYCINCNWQLEEKCGASNKPDENELHYCQSYSERVGSAEILAMPVDVLDNFFSRKEKKEEVAPATMYVASDGKMRELYRSEKSIIKKREASHGPFARRAQVSWEFKEQFRRTTRWKDLTPAQYDALDMIAVKLSRILEGDPRHLDHWKDIAGYAECVVETLEEKK